MVNFDYSPQCFVIIVLKRAEEQFPAEDQCHNYSPSPPSSGDCSIELLMQLHTGCTVKHSFFCTAALFCLLTPFFLAEPITFLHFYQKTFISEMYLRLLWLPQHHCVSSPKHRPDCCGCCLKVEGFGHNNTSFNMTLLHDYSTECWTYKQMLDCYSSATALHWLQSSRATLSQNTHLGSQLFFVHEYQRHLMENLQKWSMQLDKHQEDLLEQGDPCEWVWCGCPPSSSWSLTWNNQHELLMPQCL